MSKKIKFRPEKVQKIHCPICGELQAKVYPWGNLQVNPNIAIPPCKRCQNKEAGKAQTRVAAQKAEREKLMNKLKGLGEIPGYNPF